MVVFQHFGANSAPPWIRETALGLETGTLAVAAFFVISGFVIIEAAENFYSDRPLAFLVNRAIRILPMFAAALVIAVVADLAFRSNFPPYASYLASSAPNRFSSSEIFLNFAMVFDGLNLFSVYADHPFIVSAWTLRQEFFFYLIVALALGLSRLVPRIYSFRTPSAVLAVIFLLLSAWSLYGQRLNLSLDYAPFFIFGGCWYFLLHRAPRIWVLPLLGISLAGMLWQQSIRVASIVSYERAVGPQLSLLLLLVAVFCLLSFLRTPRSSAVTIWDGKLGNLTFSVYLIHEVVLTLVSLLVAGNPSLYSFTAGILASIVAGILFYGLTEPWLQKLRNRVRGQPLRYSFRSFSEPSQTPRTIPDQG